MDHQIADPRGGAHEGKVKSLERSGASAAKAGEGPIGSASAPEPGSASVALESLAPRFEEGQHNTYLERLEEAVKNPDNRDIALTGSYGTGKSSVLEKFGETHKDTLRLGISTLGPSDEGADLTNRIQKELVKQLLYSASPRTRRHSRFAGITPLSAGRAFRESLVAVAVVGLILAMTGLLPRVVGTGDGQLWLVQVGAWALFGALVALVAAVVRLLTYERFFVSDVSAAGTTVKLSERTSTYFDEFLDEIVHFFNEEPANHVIFEDLDRFDDPQIFEALRELNALLNNTPKRAGKDVPLRFIYAVRDSLFERLGADTHEEGGDAAAAETVRANRTKFFDVVIPVVPFISHRNARELLARLLEEAGIADLDRALVDLVAPHATDMRLLRNVRNEYLVFAERLLEHDQRPPGLSPSNLLALVVYKNFHLGDFERVSRRRSDLDRLYGHHRELVRSNIAELEKRKRDLIAGRARGQTMAPVAERLGERLRVYVEAVRQGSPYGGSHIRFQVGTEAFAQDDADAYEFWAAVARAGALQVSSSSSPNSGGQQLLTLGRKELGILFPESVEAGRWDEDDEEKIRDDLNQLDEDISFLRGADFGDLAGRPQFTTALGETVLTFQQLIDATMPSDLARELLSRGYLDRNFALYAAQFYGHFTGVDVATFIVQSVPRTTSRFALEPALRASGRIAEFFAPDLVAGMVEELFARPIAREMVGRQVAEHLGEFVPGDDPPALRAAARFAISNNIALPADQIRRVAGVDESRDLTLPLLQITSPPATADQIVAALAELGTPYSYLSSRAVSQFDVPNDEAHRAVFQTLKDAAVCTFAKRRVRPTLSVKLP